MVGEKRFGGCGLEIIHFLVMQGYRKNSESVILFYKSKLINFFDYMVLLLL
jgi:hypothetical protein